MPHRGIVRLVINTNYIKFKNTDRILQNIATVFDASVFAIFGAFLNGLPLYPIQKDKLLDFGYLEKYIKDNKITIINLTVSLFNKLIDYNPKVFDKARVILIGGEAVLPKTVNILKKNSPHIEIVNVYGPTENSDLSSCHIIKKQYEKSVPIGKPVSNSTCYILDKNQNLLPIGVPGEICVGGDGVAIGYLNNEKMTKEKFIPNKFGAGRLYRTGDLGYWNGDGTIQFVSRIDKQVKIRGFRIELKEIEAKILEFGNIKECAVIVAENNSNQMLVACIGTKNNINTKDLNTYLKTQLPFYMIPLRYMIMENLPLNINGKLDSKKLLEQLSDIPEDIVKPTNELEEGLAEIWKKVLGIENIGISKSFFEIGGDSLAAITMSELVYEKYKVKVPVKDVLNNLTIEDLASIIKNSKTLDETPIKRVPIRESYPLSYAQKRVYYASKMIGEDNLVYNVPGAILINKILDKNKVEKCFKKIIENQSAFRTYFVVEEDDVKQKIQESVEFNVKSFENKSSEIKEIIKAFPKPFDLESAPLLRVELHYLDNEKTLLLLDSHHIIMDGSSLQILINDFYKLYNEESIDNLEIEYKDYAVWENDFIESEEIKEAENYWINKFKDSDISSINLPYDYSMPAVRTYNGDKITKKINKKDFDKYLKYAKELNVSPYMLFMSAFFVLLYKYTGQEEIILGSPTAGRDSYKLKNIIGMFVNNLVVDAKIKSENKFTEFLNEIKAQVVQDLMYQNYPYDLLVKKLNLPTDNTRNPLFDVMFAYQNTGDRNLVIEGKEAEFINAQDNIAKFNLSFEIDPSTRVASLEYRTDLFKKETIERLFEHYINTLEKIVENKDIHIKDISILSDYERDRILKDFNNTYFKYDKNKHIHQLFEDQVKKTPNDIAIVFENKKLTYTQLNEKANAIAYYLKNNNYGANDIIGIMLPRSLELIIAMLGVLKSGACYIPIDPTYPQNRIEYMLNNSEAKLVLTLNNLSDNIKYENKVCIDLENNELYSLNKRNINCKISSDNSSYIIYTSGSTGLPKGVVLKHKSLTNLCYFLNNNTEFLKVNSKYKNIISVTTSSFDIFIFETLICLQRGLKIILANEEEQRVPSLLDKLIKENDAQIIQMTPSRMQFLVDNIEEIPNLSKLKYVVLAGEPLPLKLKDELISMGIKKVYNGYGPSETTVFSSFTDVTKQSFINIGRPLNNTQMYILDKDLNPLPTGINGELYISGDGVGRGYLNNTTITNERFITNPFNTENKMYKTGDLCKFNDKGELYYVERVDNQVKVRGLRIELGEIENKILEYPFIKKAVVIKQNMGNREIISAYFIASRRIRITDLRKHLLNALPSYMIPSYFTPLDEFPYTPNGKINKNELPIPNGILNNTHKYVSPKTDLEVKLVSIWENILNTKPIGITDNFFELGGDSILAMNLNVQLLKITDKIKYSDIFSFPTILELEDKINQYSNPSSNCGETNELLELQNKYNKILESNVIIPEDLTYKPIGNILLTGCTGFLGIHILNSFLQNEKGKIYAIIRKEPGMTVTEKLLNKLHYYFGDKYDNEINNRIIIIEGDASLNAFGLNQEELFKLINSVDVIINAAAKVSHYGSYQEFYMINVKSVENIINIAHTFNKKLYHISTLSVSGNSFVDQYYNEQSFLNEVEFAENNFYIGQSLDNVYIESKFEAERLIFDSILNGDDSHILRVGNLMPRYNDGKFQENYQENAYINRLKGFIDIQYVPEDILEAYLEFTPIDSTADAILKIIQFQNKQNRIFHIFNHNHVFVKHLLNLLKKYDINIKIVENDEFKKVIKNILNSKNSAKLNSLINDFDKDMNLVYDTKIKLMSEFTIKYLELCNFKWPLIKEKYIKNIIKLLRGE